MSRCNVEETAVCALVDGVELSGPVREIDYLRSKLFSKQVMRVFCCSNDVYIILSTFFCPQKGLHWRDGVFVRLEHTRRQVHGKVKLDCEHGRRLQRCGQRTSLTDFAKRFFLLFLFKRLLTIFVVVFFCTQNETKQCTLFPIARRKTFCAKRRRRALNARTCVIAPTPSTTEIVKKKHVFYCRVSIFNVAIV